MNIPIDAITNYINMVYKPNDISVEIKDTYETPEYVIFLQFDRIDDKYITNRFSNSIAKNKENNLEREIRKDVEGFFSIKTSGLDLMGYAPYKRHGLTIDVIER